MSDVKNINLGRGGVEGIVADFPSFFSNLARVISFFIYFFKNIYIYFFILSGLARSAMSEQPLAVANLMASMRERELELVRYETFFVFCFFFF